MSSTRPITLTVSADPDLARLVRMTASNVGVLSSMSVERVEDIRMAAEEAFIYACSTCPGSPVSIDFDVDDERLVMSFALDAEDFDADADGDMTATYADLILGSVCDSYQKLTSPATLVLELKADV